MAAIKERLRTGAKALRARGFFHIFFGNTLVKIISLSSAMLLPRILSSTTDYGLLSTIDNFNSYLILLNGMGLSTSVLRYCSLEESKEGKTAIFHFAFRWGMIFNGILLLIFLPLLFFSTLFADGTYAAARMYILVACLLPSLTYGLDLVLVYMRSNFMNRSFARISVLYTLFYAGFQILFAFFAAIRGVIIGRYIAVSAIVAIGLFILFREKVLAKEPPMLSSDHKKELLRYGLGSMFANALSMIMPLNETLVINMALQDLSTTAYYKAASTVPSNIQYVALSVATFIYPYFAKNTGKTKWVKKYSLLTLAGMSVIMGAAVVIGFFASPYIIRIIYGKDYLPAVPIMQAMWVAYALNSALRIPLGNILAAMGELRFNIILSAVTCILHFGLDWFFISNMGISGAAYALTISYALSGAASFAYLLYYCRRVRRNEELIEK